MTLTELMIVCMVAVMVAIAAASIYVASVETWQYAGAKLALQRSADEAFVRITADIRSGSEVTITKSGTEISITQFNTSIGDSTVGTYLLVEDEVTNIFGNTILTGVDSLAFESQYGEKVRIALRLVDPMNTPENPYDDVSQYLETVAVCRNRLPE